MSLIGRLLRRFKRAPTQEAQPTQPLPPPDLSLLDSHTMAAMETLARRRNATFGVQSPLGWFDGFWDFVVTQRSHLARAAAVHIGGCVAVPSTPWYVLYWHPPDEEEPRLDIFVEAKDRRPGVMAPWPVHSIYFNSGEPVPPRENPPRSRDEASATALTEIGFVVDLGYWGTHVRRCGFSGADVEYLDRALTLALALHDRDEYIRLLNGQMEVE